MSAGTISVFVTILKPMKIKSIHGDNWEYATQPLPGIDFLAKKELNIQK